MTPSETRAALVEAMADGDWLREDGRLGIAGDMLNALFAKLRELGLKIVPIEATEKMNEALVETVTNGTCIGSNDVVEWAPCVEDRAWSAMLAAAPDVLGGGDE